MKRVLFIIIFIIGIMAINPSNGYALTGKQLFSKDECFLCHTVNGKGGSIAPNLSAIGKIRTYSWIRRQIRNPKLNFFTPNSFAIFHGKIYRSIMPANKKMSAGNLNKLASYLASLK
jgi:mono/diheme cytochrome c family protein